MTANRQVSFNIPPDGDINRAVQAWVDSLTGGRRSAAIREAIYHYHIRGTTGTLDSLHELLRQQAEQLQAIQAELQELRRRGFAAPETGSAPNASEQSQEKLKKLTGKFF